MKGIRAYVDLAMISGCRAHDQLVIQQVFIEF